MWNVSAQRMKQEKRLIRTWAADMNMLPENYELLSQITVQSRNFFEPWFSKNPPLRPHLKWMGTPTTQSNV